MPRFRIALLRRYPDSENRRADAGSAARYRAGLVGRQSLALRTPEQEMTPEEWARIKGIFDAAAELPRSDREQFVGAACAGDTRLSSEVNSLLAALEDAGDFIEAPVPGQERVLTNL